MSIEGLPRNYRRAALAAFVGELQGHPMFKNGRLIRSWRLWCGDGKVSEPTVGEMPCCQVRWIGGEVHRIASTRRVGGPNVSASEVRPTLGIELWTRGNDQYDALDLADAIHDALAPQDPATRAALEARLAAAGIRDWRLAREIAPPDLSAYSATSIYSVGTYALTIFIGS